MLMNEIKNLREKAENNLGENLEFKKSDNDKVLYEGNNYQIEINRTTGKIIKRRR